MKKYNLKLRKFIALSSLFPDILSILLDPENIIPTADFKFPFALYKKKQQTQITTKKPRSIRTVLYWFLYMSKHTSIGNIFLTKQFLLV